MDSWPVRAGLAAGILAVVLACLLVPDFKAANPQSSDVLAQVLGGTAVLASEKAYQEADTYFHAGVRTDGDHHGRDEDHGTHPQSMQSGLPLIGWVRTMQGATAPQAHRHVEGEESDEILPWFVVATRLNPHHIEAWSTGSYWFYQSGDPRRSERFLDDGIRHNPRDYRLYFDRGVLYFHLKQWDKSVRDLETAHRLWKDLNEDSPYDRKAIQRYMEYARDHRSLSDGQ